MKINNHLFSPENGISMKFEINVYIIVFVDVRCIHYILSVCVFCCCIFWVERFKPYHLFCVDRIYERCSR